MENGHKMQPSVCGDAERRAAEGFLSARNKAQTPDAKAPS